MTLLLSSIGRPPGGAALYVSASEEHIPIQLARSARSQENAATRP